MYQVRKIFCVILSRLLNRHMCCFISIRNTYLDSLSSILGIRIIQHSFLNRYNHVNLLKMLEIVSNAFLRPTRVLVALTKVLFSDFTSEKKFVISQGKVRKTSIRTSYSQALLLTR